MMAPLKDSEGQNVCIAFTVEDLDAEYERVLGMGTRVIQGPTVQPWGMRAMSFYDPDNHIVYFRSKFK